VGVLRPRVGDGRMSRNVRAGPAASAA
jgi:hypothetical protein